MGAYCLIQHKRGRDQYPRPAVYSNEGSHIAPTALPIAQGTGHLWPLAQLAIVTSHFQAEVHGMSVRAQKTVNLKQRAISNNVQWS